jgi:hypothetical protein
MRKTYNKELTALPVIDPYNDFISEHGKIWPRIRRLRKQRLRPHMLQVLNAARQAGFVSSMAYHRYRPGDYES